MRKYEDGSVSADSVGFAILHNIYNGGLYNIDIIASSKWAFPVPACKSKLGLGEEEAQRSFKGCVMPRWVGVSRLGSAFCVQIRIAAL